jgi:predicted transcriptional regulator
MSKVQNEKNRELATYYRERGFSYSEIANLCGVAKSTVSNWLRDNPVSAGVTEQNTRRAQQENTKRLRLINTVRKREQERAQDTALTQAKNIFSTVSQEPLFIAGAVLARSAHQKAGVVRFSSTEPEQHELWLRFVQRYSGLALQKPRFQLVVYQNHSLVSCEKWWRRRLSVPKKQWYSTQVLAQGSEKQASLHFGVGSTIIANASFAVQITYWQKEIVQTLLR